VLPVVRQAEGALSAELARINVEACARRRPSSTWTRAPYSALPTLSTAPRTQASPPGD